MKANPHCMKKIIIDIMSKKKWSTFLGNFSCLVLHLSWKWLLVSLSYFVAIALGDSNSMKFENIFLKQKKKEMFSNIHPSWPDKTLKTLRIKLYLNIKNINLHFWFLTRRICQPRILIWRTYWKKKHLFFSRWIDVWYIKF